MPSLLLLPISCPFCNKAKELLTEGGYNPKVVELNKVENGSEIHSVVIEMSGLKTVPNVFVHGKSIGGSDDTKKLHESGKLKSMLQANE